MSDFSRLLKDVIDSVDRFGLKSCHLKKPIVVPVIQTTQ